MKTMQSRIVLGVVATLALATAATGTVLLPRDSDSVGRETGRTTVEAIPNADEALQATSTNPLAAGAVEPDIPAEFSSQAEFIRQLWADGPNLADRYIQITVPCSASYDCRKLIIGDVMTGQLVDTGMGYPDMVNLGSYSVLDGDSVELAWENIPAGNCAMARYRWTGRELAAVSDILEFDYDDAGCDRNLGQGLTSD